MGARELLVELAGAGFSVEAEGDKLLIRPASLLTHEMRGALRAAKLELLELLTSTRDSTHDSTHATSIRASRSDGAGRPYRLTKCQRAVAHAEPWDEGAIARFNGRVQHIQRQGFGIQDAEDLAELMHLRDVEADYRHVCVECRHYRPGRCGNHRAAGLQAPAVGPDLAVLMQHCGGFSPAQ